jgi:solute carrier family 25 (mitochondrial 2-oxodicarboxylate transporter), member 21
MYPVDIVRALVMAQASGQKSSVGTLVKNFYQTHGAIGFIKQGLGPEMARAIFSRVIKFWLQPMAHTLIFKKPEKQGSSISKGIAGALATVPEVLIISPFENLKLAQQLDKEKKFKNSSDVFNHLIKTRGLTGLYLGYFGMQLRQVLWTGTFFLTLDIYQKKTEKAAGGKKVYTDVIAGFLAGVSGTVVNCWTDVVRTVIQKQAIADTFDINKPRQPLNLSYLASGVSTVVNTTHTIYSNRGIAGLYSGFLIKSLYLGGSGSFLAVLIPRFKKLWGVE